MSQPASTGPGLIRSVINDCWNKIGVRGDSSCPELEKHIHCRNCPVYSAVAADLLDSDLPTDYLLHWTPHVAEKKRVAELDTHSVVIFRIGAEWLALPTHVFKEIGSLRVIHSLPHRRSGVVLGLANIRGELLVCVSLRRVLGLEEPAGDKREKHRALNARLLVIECEGSRAVCPVDEVYGIQRFHPRELKEVPATVARATATYTKAVLPWQMKSVGLLDDQLLFYTLNRSLASATVT
jgi:chemotaxis-related protein WspD